MGRIFWTVGAPAIHFADESWHLSPRENYDIFASGEDGKEQYSALISRGVIVNVEFLSSRAWAGHF